MHTLCAKSGIAHALCIGGKVVNRLLWNTAAFVWWWGDGGELANLSHEVLNLAMNEQVTCVFGPRYALLGRATKTA